MPFKSEAQRKFMWAKHPEMAKRWAEHTPKGTKLPEHVKKADEHKDRLPGGKADKSKPGDFNQRQLRAGVKVEGEEHTRDPRIAKEIAMDHLKESPTYYTSLKRMEARMPKRAELDPKILFAQAMQGAIAGAIVGSRRSLDDKTLQGVAHGAAIGALGGVIGGQIQSGSNPSSPGAAGALAGGAAGGYLASRGPRGESRPDLHLRIDKGNGLPLPSPKPPEKQASEMRDLMKAKKNTALARFIRSRSGSAKTASGNIGHAVELAGLGILARPSVQAMRGKEMSEKSKHLHEIAGLGVLAAPSAHALGKHLLGKIKSAPGLAKAGGHHRGHVNGDPETVDSERAMIASTPFGERLLADYDGANQDPMVARMALRRMTARMIPRPQQLQGA